MPAKNSTLRYGNRDYVFNTDFYDQLVEKNNDLGLSYLEVSKILRTHTKNISEVIEEEIDGFKLPKGLGYFCAVKYTPKKEQINWKKTHEIGKPVYFTNFDTFGYCTAVKLFRVGRPNNNSFYDVFMFRPCKTLAQSIMKKFKAGKIYSEYRISDFIEKSRLENLYSKRYRKEIKK
jgi:hypothetical protein